MMKQISGIYDVWLPLTLIW